MSYDQKPARMRVVGSGGTDKRRRSDTGAALSGAFASGGAARTPRQSDKAANGSRRNPRRAARLFLLAALIGGALQALVFQP